MFYLPKILRTENRRKARVVFAEPAYVEVVGGRLELTARDERGASVLLAMPGSVAEARTIAADLGFVIRGAA